MHNNAIGPELCGNPANKANDFYGQRPRYVDGSNIRLLPRDQQPACFQYDPSVSGRFELFKRSMDALLNPAKRIPKVTLLNEDVTMRIGPKLWDGTDRGSCSASSSPSLTRSTGAASPPARWATSSTRSSWSTWCAPRPSQGARAGSGETLRRRDRQEGPGRPQGDRRRGHQAERPGRCAQGAALPRQAGVFGLHRRDRERGSPLRRRPVRCRQEGADRLPRNPVSRRPA